MDGGVTYKRGALETRMSRSIKREIVLWSARDRFAIYRTSDGSLHGEFTITRPDGTWWPIQLTADDLDDIVGVINAAKAVDA